MTEFDPVKEGTYAIESPLGSSYYVKGVRVSYDEWIHWAKLSKQDEIIGKLDEIIGLLKGDGR